MKNENIIVTWIFSFRKLSQKTNRKPRIRYPDLTKEWSDDEIGKENGVVGQPDLIQSLPTNGRGRKFGPDSVELDCKMSGPDSKMVRILTDFTEQLEAPMKEARKATDQMEESR